MTEQAVRRHSAPSRSGLEDLPKRVEGLAGHQYMPMKARSGVHLEDACRRAIVRHHQIDAGKVHPEGERGGRRQLRRGVAEDDTLALEF